MAQMVGRFIKAPNAIEGRFYCEYEWRYMMKPKTRRHMKKMLSHFRRRDGKLRMLESLAAIAEQEAAEQEAAEREEARLLALEYTWPDWNDHDYPWDEYDSDYRDETIHDGVDYWPEAQDAQEYRITADFWGDSYRVWDDAWNTGFKAGQQYERRMNRASWRRPKNAS